MKRTGVVVIGVALLAAGCGGGGSSPTTTSTSAPATTSTTVPTSTTTTAPGSTSTTTPASSSTTVPTSTTAPKATVAMHYSSLASSVDSAYATWHADVVGAKTISQLVAPAATYASELSTFDHSITGIGASGKAASDIQKLIAADNVVIGDLHALSSTTSAEFSSWGARIIAAGTSAVTASNVVRSDLGLAPSAG